MRSHPAGARGFTIIELLVVAAVVAILMSVAVPSFRSSRLNSQLRASANDLVASAYLARGEAIKRASVVNMCVSADGATCGSGNWQQGWIVLSGGTVIHREAPISSDFRITSAGAINVFNFQPTGVDATAGSFTVCRATPAAGQERVVSIDAASRAWIRRTSTGSCP
jgi:type IV fimbrial biogenesis protein FimT